MHPFQLEQLVRKLDARITRMEQLLPSLATKDDLHEAVAALATRQDLYEAIARLATKDDLPKGIDVRGVVR